jgi:hypothetical protein
MRNPLIKAATGQSLGLLDIITIISLALGYENLIENRQQSKQNNVAAANDKQAKYLLEALGEKFDEQNRMLSKILEDLNDDNFRKN